MEISRRRFILLSSGALVAAPTLVNTGCRHNSDDDDSAPGDDDDALAEVCWSGVVGEISDNHAHEAVIEPEAIQAGGTATFSIQGSADHSHGFTLTQADFDSLQAGNTLVVTTTTTDHTHQVTLAC